MKMINILLYKIGEFYTSHTIKAVLLSLVIPAILSIVGFKTPLHRVGIQLIIVMIYIAGAQTKLFIDTRTNNILIEELKKMDIKGECDNE